MLDSLCEKWNILHAIKRRKADELVTPCGRAVFRNTLLKERQKEVYKSGKGKEEDVSRY